MIYVYDADDMYKDVCFFNLAAKGTEAVYSPNAQETFDRLERQLALVLEEVSEVAVAIQDKDKSEILKEVLDVGVVWMGMLQILENAGYDVWAAARDVCDNNTSKIMDNIQDAVESVEKHIADGVEAYTDTTKVDGVEYFSVRRKKDGKILKPYFFKKVDVSKYVPKVH
jgi:NTP pyrophosphatase (non-canonical NTP hydrolase)